MRTRERRDRRAETQAHMGKKRKSSIKDIKRPNADGERRPPVLESKDPDFAFTIVSCSLRFFCESARCKCMYGGHRTVVRICCIRGRTARKQLDSEGPERACA